MKNPCKDNKCILYPLCISKKIIPHCQMLQDYIDKHLRTIYKDKSKSHIIQFEKFHYSNLSKEKYLTLWKAITEFLPNTRVIIVQVLSGASYRHKAYIKLYICNRKEEDIPFLSVNSYISYECCNQEQLINAYL